MRLTVLSCLLVSISAVAQDGVVNALGTIKANQQIADLWQKQLREQVQTAATAAAEGLSGSSFGSGGTTVDVLEVYQPEYWLQLPPGFTAARPERIEIRLPVVGSWQMKFKFKVKVTQSIFGFSISKTFKLTILVANLRASARIDIDVTDPEAPVISDVPAPQADFTVIMWADQWYISVLLAVFTPFVNEWVDDAVADAIEGITPTLDALEGLPVTLGAAPPPVDSGVPTDFLTPALAISSKIQANHLSNGTVTNAHFMTPYTGTWASLYDPAFTPGPVASRSGYGDSAIWSGHYLAAEAFRYAETGDPAALANATAMLEKVRVLVNMKGTPGLLNRAIQPWSEFPDEPTSPARYIATYEGVAYVMHDFISRDQYLGVLLGCAAAYDVIDDPYARELARLSIEEMLDYLAGNGWIAYRADGSISTVWHLQFAQQLAWVNAGLMVNFGKYWTKYLTHCWLSDLAWMAPWLNTFDPHHSYYKFNLEHGAFLTWLRLEPVPIFWERGWKAFKILRKAIGHHQNAYFNLCQMSVAPWTVVDLQGETREEMRLWLLRPRRALTYPIPVPTIVYTSPASLPEFLTGDPPAGPETIAATPVPVDIRPYTDFLWQRSPFKIGAGGDGTEESPGVDFILPYWMARYYDILD